MPLLSTLLPQPITDNYPGHPLAQWALVAMTALTVGRSLAHIFLVDGGAQSVATIPLDAYPPAASAVIIGMFAQWGLSQLLLGLLYALALWRYRSLIPLMWSFVLVEWTGWLLLGLYKPIDTAGTAPGAIGNVIFPAVASVMLVLSLCRQKHGHAA